MNKTTEQIRNLKILVSAIAAEKVLSESNARLLTVKLVEKSDVASFVIAIAKTFDSPKLTRSLNLSRSSKSSDASLELSFQGSQVHYQEQVIGQTKILFKSPLPGELQARLAIESAIDRFLEYLQKVYQIVVLDESDRHVRIFLPNQLIPDLVNLWQKFINEVAFSDYGLPKFQLPGLAQTFISMLNSVTLSGRGFSTLDIPILNQGQANVLAAWYLGVWRDAKKRQDDRQQRINALGKELENPELIEKDRRTKTKELEEKETMQLKEAEKYKDNFQKSFGKLFQEQNSVHQELALIQSNLKKSGITTAEIKKLQKQQEKLRERIVFSADSARQKLKLLEQSDGDPFKLVELDKKEHPDNFKDIQRIANNFTKTATDQLNGTRGDIFAQCIAEMYRLLEITDEQFERAPPPLLTEQPISPESRSPGDDSKEFCYSCGAALDPKAARWQVLRFMFERPSQRRQSASGEGRPHICTSCSALAFASPLKVTDESIILRLEPVDGNAETSLRLKEYLRMLTSKEMNLSAGRYIVLASEKTQSGDLASQKLGQVQYALLKVASIFPVEVLSDFHFNLITQGSEPIHLASRHLIFIKGLMICYGQSIVITGKDINMALGDAVRYAQQDLPYLADYTLTKMANISNNLELEKIRALYWMSIQTDLALQGDSMDSDTRLAKRGRLYRDVAALTGLTAAFANSLESAAKKVMDKDTAEREVSKLIEKVDDAIVFCYYATLGDENKTKVEARLWRNSDNEFIYSQTEALLKELGLSEREEKGEDDKVWLKLFADDVLRAYAYFADREDYQQEKDWKELTYQLKLSLYTRFPELVRKLKTTGEK